MNLIMRRKLMLGLVMTFGLWGGLQAQGSKEELIERSLEDIRNPLVLDTLADALLGFSDDSVSLGRAYFLKGMARTYAGNPKAAANYFSESLSYLDFGKTYDERFSYEVVLKNMGIAHYRSRSYPEGDSCFFLLRALALQSGDSIKYSIALKATANALMVQQAYDSAAALMSDVALIQQRLKYPNVATTYLSLGSIYGRMQLEEEAIKWFKKALVAGERLADKRLESRVFNNLAVAHRALKNYDSANYYQYQALKLQKEMGLPIDQVESHANLARNYVKLRLWDSVDVNLERAYALLPKGRAAGRSRQNLWLLSLRYEVHRGSVKEAKSYLDSIRGSLAPEILLNDPEYLEAKAQYFELANQADSAYHYLQLSNTRTLELSKIRDAARVKAEANKVEVAAMREEQAGELRGYQLAILVLVVFLISGGAWLWYANYRVRKIRSEAAASSQPEVDVAQLEIIDAHRPIQAKAEPPQETPEKSLNLKLKSKAVISIDDLRYLQSDGHYVNLFLKGQSNPEVERSSLKEWETKLEAYDFIRIHRSYLVGLNDLKAVYASKVLLKDGTELPVSRTYKEELKNRFQAD